MFVHHCTACDRRQLIFPSQVSRVVDLGGDTLVAFTCWCGAGQTADTHEFAAA